MVSIRMIVKSGQKNELQNLGFRTYYNHCEMVALQLEKLSDITKRRPKYPKSRDMFIKRHLELK